MTLPPDSPNDAGAPTEERPLTRRELRKRQMLEDAKAGIIKPQSIFDLEYVPRARPIPTPESTVVPDYEAELASQLECAALAEAEVEPLAEPTIFDASPEPEPAPEPEPEPEPASRPEAQTPPEAVSLPAPVKSRRATQAQGSLLFQRIPEPEPQPSAVAVTTSTSTGSDEATASSSRRNLFAVVGAIVVVFGSVLTLALPAVDEPAESSASADQAQELTSDNTAQTQIDIESFESVDELEVAAEAATLRANTFTNDPTAAVQYPFDVGVPITDGFGPRSFPVSGFHDAQDFAAGYGAAVRAMAAGTVIESGTTTDGCGFGLKLKHRIDGHEVMSRYCHLAADPIVKVGDKVVPGQFVALVGATGIAFGAHLHFVVEVDGAAVDPMPFLAKYNKPKPVAKKSSSSN